jgi:hypothetical protein
MLVPLGYLHYMLTSRRRSTGPLKRTAMLLTAVAFLLAANHASAASKSGSKTHSLYQSRELWATVDVCNPSDQPNTIGIRGSMPSDGHSSDQLYMRFIVQSLDASTGKWTDLGKNADSGFVAVGSAKSTRQAGRSFELVAPSSSVTLRGLVEFQWRSATKVTYSTSRMTGAGHKSLAGADPASFSAATCVIG